MPVQTQMQVRRGTASSWTSTNPTLAAGELGFETDTGKFKIGTGSSTWTGLAYATGLNAITYLYNATAAQTTFSGADANGLTLAYTVGTEQVFLNGALQVRGSDYTATNGTSIVLTSGALAGDVLNVIAYGATTITDTYTQAQADAKFFQNANAFLAGKNKIINGDFAINQRAFTSTTTSSVFTFDRWATRATDGTSTFTAQTFTAGSAPVSGYEGTNYVDIASTGQTLTSARTGFQQWIESVRTFAGQTVTVSFWAKATSGTPAIAAYFDQNYGTGGSTATQTAGQKVTLSTSWARYSLTYSIPSISGKTIGTSDKLGLFFLTSAGSNFNTESNSLGIQTTTISLWGVQVEAGSIATPFQTATGTIQGELAACQRYYYKLTTGAQFASLGLGAMLSTSQMEMVVPFGTEMRTAPSLDQVSGTSYYGYQLSAGNQTFNAFIIDRASTKQISLYVNLSTTVGGQTGWVYANSTSTSLAFSAEL
jgi:hypothetical protein